MFIQVFLTFLSYIREKEWKREWFIKESKWKDPINRKNALVQFAIQRNIKQSKEWGSITVKDAMRSRDLKTLLHRFDCSLFKLLVSSFPGNFVLFLY